MLYTLSDIYDIILQKGIEYELPSSILIHIESIEKEIANSSIKKMYSNPTPTTTIPIIHKTPMNTSSYKFKEREKEKEKELSWENIRNFKITKIEKKEGTEKYINEIRICLNKMSNKNYDTQQPLIIQKISEMEDEEQLLKVATAIFDIASTNKFYSEIYAKIYKELMDLYPVFQTILNDFLLQFLTSISDLKYVDPNVDYDAFCNYNKQNDKKKATAVFIIHMMKQNVILPENVLDIIHNLIVKLETCMDIENQLNELEEMTELVNLFLLEGYVFLSSVFLGEIEKEKWEQVILKINEFSQLKVKDKKNLSSRVIFKYMDLCSFMNKNKK
jgi:hypothetical protein